MDCGLDKRVWLGVYPRFSLFLVTLNTIFSPLFGFPIRRLDLEVNSKCKQLAFYQQYVEKIGNLHWQSFSRWEIISRGEMEGVEKHACLADLREAFERKEEIKDWRS